LSLDHVSVLSALMRTDLSTSIRESGWAVMALEAVHLIGLTLLGGAAIIIGVGGLRPSGLRGLSVATLVAALRPLLWTGLSLMMLSGTLIALAMPFKYYGNAAFRWKMLLLLLALVATLGLFKTRQRGFALTALLLWFAVGFSGRLIGFL
jgi:hypothetical protein